MRTKSQVALVPKFPQPVARAAGPTPTLSSILKMLDAKYVRDARLLCSSSDNMHHI